MFLHAVASVRGNSIVYLGIPQGFPKDYCLRVVLEDAYWYASPSPGSEKHKQNTSLFYGRASSFILDLQDVGYQSTYTKDSIIFASTH